MHGWTADLQLYMARKSGSLSVYLRLDALLLSSDWELNVFCIADSEEVRDACRRKTSKWLARYRQRGTVLVQRTILPVYPILLQSPLPFYLTTPIPRRSPLPPPPPPSPLSAYLPYYSNDRSFATFSRGEKDCRSAKTARLVAKTYSRSAKKLGSWLKI